MNQTGWDATMDNAMNWFRKNWFTVVLCVLVLAQISLVLQASSENSPVSVLRLLLTSLLFWILFFICLEFDKEIGIWEKENKLSGRQAPLRKIAARKLRIWGVRAAKTIVIAIFVLWMIKGSFERKKKYMQGRLTKFALAGAFLGILAVPIIFGWPELPY